MPIYELFHLFTLLLYSQMLLVIKIITIPAGRPVAVCINCSLIFLAHFMATRITVKEFGFKEISIFFPFTAIGWVTGLMAKGISRVFTFSNDSPVNTVTRAWTANFLTPSNVKQVAFSSGELFTTLMITSFVFLSITAEAYKLSCPVSGLLLNRAGTVCVPL